MILDPEEPSEFLLLEWFDGSFKDFGGGHLLKSLESLLDSGLLGGEVLANLGLCDPTLGCSWFPCCQELGLFSNVALDAFWSSIGGIRLFSDGDLDE